MASHTRQSLSGHAPDATSMPLTAGPLRLDLVSGRAWRDELELELSMKELRILELLMHNADAIVSRSAILQFAWDGSYDNRSNVIDVHMASLRSKLDKPFVEKLIMTVRGSGFRLRGS